MNELELARRDLERGIAMGLFEALLVTPCMQALPAAAMGRVKHNATHDEPAMAFSELTATIAHHDHRLSEDARAIVEHIGERLGATAEDWHGLRSSKWPSGGRQHLGLDVRGPAWFPEGWTDDDIVGAIEKVAIDPACAVREREDGLREKVGVVDGVTIKVIIDPSSDAKEAIRTGYPLDQPPAITAEARRRMLSTGGILHRFPSTRGVIMGLFEALLITPCMAGLAANGMERARQDARAHEFKLAFSELTATIAKHGHELTDDARAILEHLGERLRAKPEDWHGLSRR